MARFCPTSLIGLCSAFISIGCSGQNLEGAWRGPVPLNDASDCRTRLHIDGTADLACKGRLGWVGAGKWSGGGGKLEIQWIILGQQNEPKPGAGPTMRFRFEGLGNRLKLRDEVGEYEWKRIF